MMYGGKGVLIYQVVTRLIWVEPVPPPPQSLTHRRNLDGRACDGQYQTGVWVWKTPVVRATINPQSHDGRLSTAMPGPLPPGSDYVGCGIIDPPPLEP